MITTIILFALLAIGIYLLSTTNRDTLGFIITVMTSIILLIHIPATLMSKYNYEMFVEKRNAFEQTLEDARYNENDLESAAIIQNVSEWNIDLARRKYNNTTFILEQYTDDRIMFLKPIK